MDDATDNVTVQSAIDQEHLRLLRIGFLISGGMSALFALFPLIHITMGMIMLFGSFAGAHTPDKPDVRFMGLFFVVIGATFSVIFTIVAALELIAARRLRERRSKTFCLVVAGISCFWIPVGTVLGVFTFIVLGRPSVAALFADSGDGVG